MGRRRRARQAPGDAPGTAGVPPGSATSARRRLAAAAGRGARGTGRALGRGSRSGARRVRRYTTSGGAGESGLARLVELHAVHSAGDAALAVSLAGTLFFAVPTGQARGQVALFLLLTMAPFAVVAPLIGPLLDRFRHGRRWAIGATLALRAFLAWVLAGAVASSSAWVFPAALGCLVASRAYGVTRAAAVPRLLPTGSTLVNANSRISLAGVGGAAAGGALAAALSRVGPDWSLRLAFLLYVAGTVLAVTLPARVDSDAGEEDLDVRAAAGTAASGPGPGSPARPAPGPAASPAGRGGAHPLVLRRRPAGGRLPHALPRVPAPTAPAAGARRLAPAWPGRRGGGPRERPRQRGRQPAA